MRDVVQITAAAAGWRAVYYEPAAEPFEVAIACFALVNNGPDETGKDEFVIHPVEEQYGGYFDYEMDLDPLGFLAPGEDMMVKFGKAIESRRLASLKLEKGKIP